MFVFLNHFTFKFLFYYLFLHFGTLLTIWETYIEIICQTGKTAFTVQFLTVANNMQLSACICSLAGAS